MKVLIFTHIFPYPLTEGGRSAQFNFIQEASKTNEIILVPLIPTLKKEDVKAFLQEVPNVFVEKVFYNDEITKYNFLQKIVRKMIWILRSFLPKEPLSIIDNPYFLNPVKVRKEDEISQIIEITKKNKPNIIQIDFIDNADLGLLFQNEYKTFLVLHDIRSESVQQFAHEQKMGINYENYLNKNISLKELPFINIFDGVIIFSKHDGNLAKKWNENILVNPFAVNNKYLLNAINSGNIKSLVFLGPEVHFPNVDALKWYAKEIGKELYKKFGVATRVIGKWPHTQDFKNFSFIEFVGYVNDLSFEMKDAALVVPLRVGSGIRTKILEAFAMGVPVISSSKGIEGIEAVVGEHYFKADNLEEYESAVHLLLTDISRINKMRKEARAFVEENFSQRKVTEARLEFYESIIKE